MSTKHTLNFVMAKQTPGTFVFQEVDADGNAKKASDGAVVGSLYTRKTAWGDNVPQKLTVTISPA